MKKIISTILFSSLMSSLVFAQEQAKEDESKMIREVVNLQVDKTQFAVKPAPVTTKKGKKTIEPAEAAPDTSNPLIPAPLSEIQKRMQNYAAAKAAGKYSKENCSHNGNTATCQAVFEYKTKELNPTEKVDGKITMTITIEAKEGKYRYTINNIKHVANDGLTSGGDVYNVVPECGSNKLSSVTWKRIKGAALGDARMVADELKAMMNKLSSETATKADW
ncbi:MAG: hypothetical protein JST67_08740 [Bacteroidetes bacterium]|nr:hypothetical protein [Bacteroidota bacterium]